MRNLIIFTCSTINDRYLFNTQAPWKYVSLDPAGNNLEPDINKLNRFKKLTVIIGNTDPYYIYSQSFSIYQPLNPGFLWQKYDARWKTYKIRLQKWLSQKGLKNFEVISWREFELNLKANYGIQFEKIFTTLLPKIDLYFPPKDFAWELSRLKQAFTPTGYFKTLPCPDEKILKTWIKRKFTEYMIQGLFIYIFIPNSTLIQNEKPTALRNNMYQPLIKEIFNSELPIICPFGIDDSGYQ